MLTAREYMFIQRWFELLKPYVPMKEEMKLYKKIKRLRIEQRNIEESEP